jgi:hypothetical protein
MGSSDVQTPRPSRLPFPTGMVGYAVLIAEIIVTSNSSVSSFSFIVLRILSKAVAKYKLALCLLVM